MNTKNVFSWITCFSCLFFAIPALGQGYTPIMVEAKRWVKEKTEMPWEKFETRIIDNLIGYAPVETSTNKYGSDTSARFEATGYFRVEKQGGRWWVIDPEGYRNINIAVNSLYKGGSEGTREAFDRIYETDERWMKISGDSLVNNYFTGTGSWSVIDPILEYNKTASKPLVYTPNLHFMTSYGKIRGGTYQLPGNIGFPNQCIFVFDEEFESFCMEHAKQVLKYKDDKNLFGFFSDNELPIGAKNIEGYLSLKNKKDPGYLAAKEWLGKKKIKQKDITDLERNEFARYVADRYYSIVSKALKTYAPNHMYLGSRLHGGVTRINEVLQAAGKYSDIISINYYGRWTPELALIKQWEENSGKPFMITEFYTKAMDAGLANKTGAGFTVKTQKDRGYAYQHFCLGLLESKFCVGWHYFKYQDNDPTAENVDPSNLDSNKGIVSNRYIYYDELLTLMKQLNGNIYSLIDYLDR